MSFVAVEAVDLFAGTGWGVACKALGIDEVGVENMPEARATREANGMRNWLADVWDVLENAPINSPEFKRALLIASPPCQTFSMAGHGAGRKALDEVLGLIDSRAYFDVAKLREFGERHDMRTALVLTPLTYVAHHIPTYVVLEQVPQVLPVWERIAVELREWGYSVVTGILNAEQYGLPQTRKRAILIARADGVEARMPTPTHNRYNPRAVDGGRYANDLLRPWVSMAEALGWGMTGSKTMQSQYSTGHGENAGELGERGGDEPAATVTSKAYSNRVFIGNDKLEHSASRRADEPAPTITGGHDSGNRVWQGHQKPDSKSTSGEPDAYQTRADDKPAPTVTSGSRSAKWLHGETGQPVNLDPGKPATTVAADPRLTAREHHFHGEQNATSTRVTVAEASALQSYPADFDWAPVIPVMRNGVDTGRTAPMSKTKAFLQIGNAVPPLLAQHVLSTILDDMEVD